MALIDEKGARLTYAELSDTAFALAGRAGKRCLAFNLCENSIGSVIGYVGFLNNGIVPAMLNADLEEDLLWNLLDAYRPRYIWLPETKKGLLEKWRPVYGSYGYVLLETDYESGDLLFDELALLLATSGSTGSPKFVRQSYGNISSNTEAIIEYLKLDSSERPITTLPMHYTYGLSIINTHLAVGATILLTDKTLMQKEFWQFFREREATSFGGVPYTYEMLEKLRFYRMDIPSLKTMTQAGGKLVPELHEKFARYASDSGRNFVVMYGQCEATARMGYLPADKAVEKRGSMGVAIPGGKFRLVDAKGNEITTPYTTGELIYEGENVTLGYAEKRTDLAKGDEWHGVLETGDMAQFDEDGYYYIVGRKKRFLKIYGNRVNLDELDRLIKGKFDAEVACAGRDDHLYIFFTEGRKADAIREYVIKKTKLNPAAFRVVAIEKIPMNDSGKIRYSEFEKYYAD